MMRVGEGVAGKVTDELAAVAEMKTAGKNVTQIARVTGLSRPTVYRLLEAR